MANGGKKSDRSSPEPYIQDLFLPLSGAISLLLEPGHGERLGMVVRSFVKLTGKMIF
jgi:hypothetical protein